MPFAYFGLFPPGIGRRGPARRAFATIASFFSERRRLEAAILAERQRLARELHDGVLQSLAGATFQLDTISRLVGSDPEAARALLQETQTLIADEQAELRDLIDGTRRAAFPAMISCAEFGALLDRICSRATQWGTRITLTKPDTASIPTAVSWQICRLVEEAISNVVRHAHARGAQVQVRVVDSRVVIFIEDDGRGFPFQGRYDLAALDAMRLGPVSLRERVASLGGTLVLTSTTSGSRLEISVPLQPVRTSASKAL